jgi:hypothetical protein
VLELLKLSSNVNECKPLAEGIFTTTSSDGMLDAMPRLKLSISQQRQGLTLVPISAQLELICPPYDPT